MIQVRKFFRTFLCLKLRFFGTRPEVNNWMGVLFVNWTEIFSNFYLVTLKHL
jgi:hypothetical protein